MRELTSHDHLTGNRDISTVERVLKRSENAKRARNVRARLEFANFKVNNGWMNRTLPEVSKLYLRQETITKQAIESNNSSGPVLSHVPANSEIMHWGLRSANDRLGMVLTRTGSAHVTYCDGISRDPSPETAAAELILSFAQSPLPYRHVVSTSPPNPQGLVSSSPKYQASVGEQLKVDVPQPMQQNKGLAAGNR